MASISVRSTIPWRRSLSTRLLAMTVGLILLAEFLVLVPVLTFARRDWLERRLSDAQIVGFSPASAVSDASSATNTMRDGMLHRSGIDAIRVDALGRTTVVLVPGSDPSSSRPLDVTAETLPASLGRACGALLGVSDERIEITAPSALEPGARLTVQLRGAELTSRLRHVARAFAIAALAIAVVAGLLIYAVLLGLLLRPMDYVVGSIRALRADSECAPPPMGAEAARLSGREMTAAAGELGAMRSELRTGLWRNARLAAIGVAVSKVSHDLRGVLSPALLAAERLQGSADPGVSRSGDMIVRAVDRAIDLMRATLEFAREAPAPSERTRGPLRAIVREAADPVQAAMSLPLLEFTFGDEIEVEADRTQLIRVFANLLRNAAEAGARTVRLSVESKPGEIAIVVTDDGHGLPDAVRERLFRPFVSGRDGGAGLGLAIVRDLMLANRGDVALVSTGPHGTVFRLTLPAMAVYRPAPLPSGAA